MIEIVAVRGSDEPLLKQPVDRLPDLLKSPGVMTWVRLSPPIGDAEMTLLRDVFRFHPLAIEDCVGENEQPKVDDFENHLYVMTHGIRPGATPEETEIVEMDAFVSGDYLVTYNHLPSRSLDAVWELVQRTGHPLRRGPMTAFHAILDRQIDSFEPLIEAIEARLEELEGAVFARPHETQIETMLLVRRNILQLKRWMTREREVVQRLARGDFPLVKKADRPMFQDAFDHISRYADLLENAREMTASLLQAYMSVASNRLNEVMRFLTVFTAMLMPLTVVTGVYGMNFQHMPELGWRWGYYGVLGLMAGISGFSLWYFHRRGWLGRPPAFTAGGDTPAPVALPTAHVGLQAAAAPAATAAASAAPQVTANRATPDPGTAPTEPPTTAPDPH